MSNQIDQKTAKRYMLLAECFGEKLPDNIPLSGLYELSEPKNDDFRDEAVGVLAGMDKVSLKDVTAAIEQVKTPQSSELEDVLTKVGEMSEKDSYDVFLKIVEHIGIAEVQEWLEKVDLCKEAA